MTHPKLVIFGYSEAAMFLRKSSAEVCGVISIHGAREYGVEWNGPRLDLRFDDTEIAERESIQSLQRSIERRRWAAQNGIPESPPTLEDAKAIISFAESLRNSSGALLCHCNAGVSRAPAAALICLTVWLGAGSEQACYDKVIKLRPAAVPHRGLVRFADELLLRKGRLTAVVRPLD